MTAWRTASGLGATRSALISPGGAPHSLPPLLTLGMLLLLLGMLLVIVGRGGLTVMG